MNNDQKIQQLEQQVRELMAWKELKTQQQISFPLDQVSKDILDKYYLHVVSTVNYFGGVGANNFSFSIAKQGNVDYEIDYPIFSSYSVNVSTNYITVTSGNFRFYDTQPVSFFTDGTAPAPLTAGIGTTYYVRDSDGRTFKVATTSGGVAIDITDVGTGRQFINFG